MSLFNMTIALFLSISCSFASCAEFKAGEAKGDYSIQLVECSKNVVTVDILIEFYSGNIRKAKNPFGADDSDIPYSISLINDNKKELVILPATPRIRRNLPLRDTIIKYGCVYGKRLTFKIPDQHTVLEECYVKGVLYNHINPHLQHLHRRVISTVSCPLQVKRKRKENTLPNGLVTYFDNAPEYTSNSIVPVPHFFHNSTRTEINCLNPFASPLSPLVPIEIMAKGSEKEKYMLNRKHGVSRVSFWSPFYVNLPPGGVFIADNLIQIPRHPGNYELFVNYSDYIVSEPPVPNHSSRVSLEDIATLQKKWREKYSPSTITRSAARKIIVN